MIIHFVNFFFNIKYSNIIQIRFTRFFILFKREKNVVFSHPIFFVTTHRVTKKSVYPR